ncbi:MAG TPA: hypothetical protein VFK05_29700 [Polyangiaceae bacterium]|nr:hypothetical protein [Polyangiaceae bacterium]
MKPIIGLLLVAPIVLYGLALALKVDPFREGALVLAFWTCLITCGTGVKRAWSAGSKERAVLPIAVFGGCWLGGPFLAGWLGRPSLAYSAFAGPPIALVLGFRLVLLYPPKV